MGLSSPARTPTDPTGASTPSVRSCRLPRYRSARGLITNRARIEPVRPYVAQYEHTLNQKGLTPMLAGLASPSHLILVLVLLLFGARRIPDLAKSLGTGLEELREGVSPGTDARTEVPEGKNVRSEAHAESRAEPPRAHTDHGSC